MYMKTFTLDNIVTELNLITKDKKIVLVSGCYDLLHIGHVKFLNCCKKEGDILVVGVNSDEIIRNSKGDMRPIIPENDRAFLVSNLKCVDFVFIKREPFKNKAIKIISPNKVIFCNEKDQDFSKYKKIIDEYAKYYPEIECVILNRKSAGTDLGSSTSKIINEILKKYKTSI